MSEAASPDVPDLTELARVADAAAATDGAAPLDEALWRALRHRPQCVRTWQRDNGFAVLTGHQLGLVVAPDHRGRGTGTALLDDVLATHPGPLEVWSHADHPAAAALAASHGFRRMAELWVLRRDDSAPLPAVEVPAGVSIRSYRPTDRAELLRVNAAAFAGHPDQAGMDEADLAERMAQPWHSDAGLLVVVEGDRMLGFHWTKQHSAEVGEVYVIGIDPPAQGRGLGRALTLAGLHHLADQGVTRWLLYVDADNTAGLRTYRGLGFTHAEHDTHVRYARG